MSVDITLFDRLPEPVLLVTATGGTLYANAAFHQLVSKFGVPAQLSGLFGPPVTVVLSEARRTGAANAFLPLVVGDDLSRGFRLNVRGGAEDGTLAVQLADLSEEVAWRHQLFLRNSELSVLNDIGTALSATLDLSALARRIWEQTGRIMDHTHFVIALHDGGAGPLQVPLRVEDGAVIGSCEIERFGNGPIEHVLLTRQPLLLNGAVNAQLVQLGLRTFKREPVSFVATPILADGMAMGVIELRDHEQAGRFDRHELGILSIVATQAGAAIRNARLYEAIKSAYEELTATQARLLETERLRGVTETVGALNHEVNNPLATIVGTAQLLLRKDDLDADTRTKAERVLEAAKRIQFVTSKMATLIQAHSRPYPGQVQILDLSASVAEMETPTPNDGVSRVFRFMRAEAPAETRGPAPRAPRDESAA